MTFILLTISLLLFITFLFLAFIYKKCPFDRILIKYCPLNNKFIRSVPSTKGTFIFPYINSYIIVPEGLNTIGIKLDNILTKDNYKINICLVITYEFCLREDSIQNAINNSYFFYTKNIPKKIKKFISDKIEGTIKTSFINELENNQLILGRINNDLSNKLKFYGIDLKESVLTNTKII